MPALEHLRPDYAAMSLDDLERAATFAWRVKRDSDRRCAPHADDDHNLWLLIADVLKGRDLGRYRCLVACLQRDELVEYLQRIACHLAGPVVLPYDLEAARSLARAALRRAGRMNTQEPTTT